MYGVRKPSKGLETTALRENHGLRVQLKAGLYIWGCSKGPCKGGTILNTRP